MAERNAECFIYNNHVNTVWSFELLLCCDNWASKRWNPAVLSAKWFQIQAMRVHLKTCDGLWVLNVELQGASQLVLKLSSDNLNFLT